MVDVPATDFPEALPEADCPRWQAMTVAQRERARKRLDAIMEWQTGKMPFDRALEASGLSRTRFYSVAAEFRTVGTLASLGAFAGAGASRERLDPDVVNALQAVVADVVAMNQGASVSQLVRLMVEAAGVGGSSRLPGSTRLRGIVETEQRRRAATGQAGHALKLDVTAINLPRAGGRPYLMFTLVDEGTRLIFGAWTGASLDLAAGYRSATLDAVARLGGSLAHLRWADRTVRVDMTVGSDRDEAAAIRIRLIEGGVRAQVNLAPGRYGRYFRRLVGDRMGRIGITPLRTVEGPAVPDNGDMALWSDEAAAGAVRLALEEHNASILAGLDVATGRPAPPDDLARTLDILSR